MPSWSEQICGHPKMRTIALGSALDLGQRATLAVARVTMCLALQDTRGGPPTSITWLQPFGSVVASASDHAEPNALSAPSSPQGFVVDHA